MVKWRFDNEDQFSMKKISKFAGNRNILHCRNNSIRLAVSLGYNLGQLIGWISVALTFSPPSPAPLAERANH
jgi:hypothetical protein